MSKIYTAVKLLSLLALLTSPSAFAGRDSGGNGDPRVINGAGDDVHIPASDRCRENSLTSDVARECEYKNSQAQADYE